LIEPELWQRVNENIKRPDRAAVQNEKGGRAPKADFMLRKLCFCGECGRAMYAVTRHGKRIYVCCAQLQRRGTCSSLKVPAELADERILEHLTTFVGSVEEWIGERLAERSDEQVVLERSLERARTKLDELTDLREQRMAELIEVGITTIGMEAIQRIDRQVEAQEKKIADGEAQLAEWTAQLSADGILDFYNRIVDLVKGRIARANGIAEINVVLHDSLTGVWLSYDGKTLTADVTFRETGDDYWDECLMEMFGNLEARPEAIDEQREALAGQLPNTPPRRW
jgi:hypothetical protein